jgi:hypothetical protein
MMTNTLNVLSQQLAKLLNGVLPSLSKDWWQTLVLDKLTSQQLINVRIRGSTQLTQLDLASLLRVADQNWHELRQKRHINREAFNWLKEAQTIRNRWAHAPVEGLPNDLCYRDMDTVERLLQALGADGDVLEELQRQRKTLLNQIAPTRMPNAELLGWANARINASPRKPNPEPQGPANARIKVVYEGITYAALTKAMKAAGVPDEDRNWDRIRADLKAAGISNFDYEGRTHTFVLAP